MNYDELEQMAESQGRDEKSKNLLKGAIEKCKREKKSPKQALSEINQIIVNPDSIGVC